MISDVPSQKTSYENLVHTPILIGNIVNAGKKVSAVGSQRSDVIKVVIRGRFIGITEPFYWDHIVYDTSAWS